MKIQSTLFHWVSTYLVIVTHKSNNILQYQNRSPCYKIMCNFQNQQQHFHPHWKLTTSIPKGLPDFWVIRKKNITVNETAWYLPKTHCKTSWWLNQPVLKNMTQKWIISPGRVEKKNIWNHHPENFSLHINEFKDSWGRQLHLHSQ